MARSSSVDSVEKFRFNVFVFNIAFNAASLAQNFTGFLRAGFSEVGMPRQSTGSIEYRENIDATHPQLIAGLTKYEPISLRRGVTSNSDFSRWAKDTHNASGVTGILRARSDSSPPSEIESYRRDVLILVYGRRGAIQTSDPTGISQRLVNVAGAATTGFGLSAFGDVKKAWLLRDAWVSSYKPGDNLSATEDANKLIEEIELRYESFEEISLESLISQGIDLTIGELT